MIHPPALLLITLWSQAPEVPAPPKASAEEVAVVKELSWARSAPREYARFLRELRPFYEGNRFKRPGQPVLATVEGAAALEEAIAFLEKATPIGPLRWNEGLSRAARDHVQDQGPTRQTGHTGTRGSTLQQRLLRRGLFLSTYGEVINYGLETPRMTAIQLLIDDGVAGRGHRRLIFNPDMHAAGAATGPHLEYESMTVVDLADGFTENP
jgi:uncharacterized protein YkwD